MRRLLATALTIVAVTACTDETAPTTTGGGVTGTEAAADPGFYLNLVWHQHQPRYPLNEEGLVSRPWVRVHATKDYLDMASLVAEFPEVSVTFNLTPVLLLQLQELEEGAKDVYWALSEIPASELSEGQALFISERFFDTNPKVIARFPRYQQLADDRGRPFDVDELRDLQVLFNLAWTDPDFLEVEPLSSLVSKGSRFTEEDKEVLFAEHQRIISEVIPLHARLWEEGHIEVSTTPLAHPILPLLADTSLASVGDPTAQLPENRFQEVLDADQQVIRGLDVAGAALGRRPVGMWPGEGAIAQTVMSLFSKNGVRWTASGEEVLAKSLGIGSFTRDQDDLVAEADLLYRPWQARLRRNDPVPVFFRDGLLSDLIGFEYSGMDGPAAADDFMERLRRIRESLDVDAAVEEGSPYVVTVILDGENAWEHYDNDGKDFLRALYGLISESDWVATITPSEYLERFAEPEDLDEVWPGSWFQPNFATWIGEEEEARAWDYLYAVRQDLAAAEGEPGYEAAYQAMLFAEGSDWFWWYGADQESGDDGYFDTAFRESLGRVYDALGKERPAFLQVPIIPEAPITAEATPAGTLKVSIDGNLTEWSEAGAYRVDDTRSLLYGFDRETLHLAWLGESLAQVLEPVVLYLGVAPRGSHGLGIDGEVLGFGASSVLTWDGDTACVYEGVPEAIPAECTPVPAAPGRTGIEFSVPLELLGPIESGTVIIAKVQTGGMLLPEAGPMAFQVPDISDVELFLEVADPTGDDHGPGSYTYPTDVVFTPGSYDLEGFSVGTEGDELVVTFDVVARVDNPWGSPRGLSVQTFDLYLDTDPGEATGSRVLLPGRNASLPRDSGWEYAVTVEGWEPAVYLAHPDGTLEETKPSFEVTVFADSGRTVVRLPLSLFADGDPRSWGYAAVVLSQEGFPSPGVRRVRDVEVSPQQWRLGGAPADVNHTRIIDVATPNPGEQEEMLSDYQSSATLEGLGPDDFGKVPVLTPG